MYIARNLLVACLFFVLAPILSLSASATGLSSQDLIQLAQAKPDKDEKDKKRAQRKRQRGDAKQADQQRQRAQRRKQGPDRANQQRQRELREQRQQRKALRQQRQRQKALKGEQHRRRTIDADRQRQQQLREERNRQRALRNERQRQKARKGEQRQQQRTQRHEQKRERELRQRQRNEQRQRAQRERRENIVKQTDRHTVRTRKRIDRRGRVQYSTSRHYRVRDRQYRNRYRNGRSIYFLPPFGVSLAPDLYYLYGSRASYRDYVDLFEAPPVMDIPRRYTMDEIVEDPEVRSMVRSINIDMITFASGSAVITDDQLYKLDDLANAMLEVLQKDPYEKFLIEGHTDATGSDEANLLLSEERAAAVQTVLIEQYGIPADNLEAVGYGEQYLLIDTHGPERRNRRVTMRAVGDLLAQGN